MSGLLKQLEEKFGDKAYIDIEVNNLEDAYINIAKEEEKLLENLREHGVQRQSVLELKRAMEAQASRDTAGGRAKKPTLTSNPSRKEGIEEVPDGHFDVKKSGERFSLNEGDVKEKFLDRSGGDPDDGAADEEHETLL